MAAAAATITLERLAGEALAVYVARIVALLPNVLYEVDAAATVIHCEYNVPTFSVQCTVPGLAGAAVAIVALDRNPGEAIGVGTALGGDIAFCGRLRVALAVPAMTDAATCFQTVLAATIEAVALWDPPTCMFLYTAVGAGNVCEVMGSDNVVDGADVMPAAGGAAGWANAGIWSAVSKAGSAIFVGG